MRTRALIPIITLFLVGAGAGGYLLRAQRTDGSLVMSLTDVVREEHLVSQDSFSRIRNTISLLDALSKRHQIEITDALWAYAQLPKNTEVERTEAEQVLQRIILAAETAVQEFEGTVQQLEVTYSLLIVLLKAERFDRWTEVYLKALQDYPTHPLVARLANDALKNSKQAGQQERVLKAFSRLSALGLVLDPNAEIETPPGPANFRFSQIPSSRAAADVCKLEACGQLD